MALFKIWSCMAIASFAKTIVADDACGSLLKDVCTDEGDEAIHLLQRHSRKGTGSQQVLQAGERTSIKPINCSKYLNPLQVKSKDDGSGFEVSELDIKDGSYKELFAIPFSDVDEGFEVINSCGINPTDSILYCTIYAGGSWIIRLDDSGVEFVVRLPQHGWNSAAFSSGGLYYLSDPQTGFIIVKDLHNMTGYADKWDQGLKAEAQWLKDKKRIYPPGWSSVADVVVVNANLAGCVAEYVMSLHGPLLQIAQYDEEDDKWSGGWVVEVEKPYRWDNIYGAGWNFDDKVFFATNRGTGVYQVPLDEVNLTSGAKVTLIEKGPSDAAVHNDGVNCPEAPDPWSPSKLKAFDCTKYNGKALHLRKTQDSGYQVADMNMTTGNSSKIFNVPLNMTDPGIKSLNAVAISPKDSIIYGVMERVGEWEDPGDGSWWPGPHYFVRFNAEKIEYVMTLNISYHPIAGTFDKAGNFYYVGGDRLYIIRSPDTLKGFSSASNGDLPLKQYTNGSKFDASEPMADLVAIDADFDGEGETEWLLSVAHPVGKVVVIKPGENFKEDTQSWSIPAEYEIDSEKVLKFGAGWVFENEAYFSSNDGEGVFKIPKKDITIPPPEGLVLNLEKVGNSAYFPDNDGMNCMLSNPACEA
mmetsp:Transcript_95469/g.165842  ORF Transcript_95469/g.165842 Transcript_95469/m.165842 type:complete len:639 (+) Transcript_95469:108-2024(+)